MMRSKKAQGLSMNVIIIAAIALLVLVILAVLLFQATGRTAEGTSCTSLQGTCAASQPPGNYIPNPAFDSTCQRQGDRCYIPLGTQ